MVSPPCWRAIMCSIWKGVKGTLVSARWQYYGIEHDGVRDCEGKYPSPFLAALSEEATCFRLQNGNQIDGTHVRFVFDPFFFRELPFVCFFRQFLNARIQLRIGSKSDDLSSHCWREASVDRLEYTVKGCGWTHADSLAEPGTKDSRTHREHDGWHHDSNDALRVENCSFVSTPSLALD